MSSDVVVEECAYRLASMKMEPNESVLSYSIRFRTAMADFQSAVEQVGRTPWNALTLVLWQKGLRPEIHRIQVTQDPATSFRVAEDRARRIEANLWGLASTASAMPIFSGGSQQFGHQRRSGQQGRHFHSSTGKRREREREDKVRTSPFKKKKKRKRQRRARRTRKDRFEDNTGSDDESDDE